MIDCFRSGKFTLLNTKQRRMKLTVNEIFKTFILSIGVFLFVLDLFIINVSLPSIQHSLHLANSAAQWIIILYVIGYASLLINAGKAGEVYGRKKLYVIGMIGFTVSSFICGLSNDIYVLLAGRLLQGISSGLMVPQGIALITILFAEQQKRTMALGIYGSFAGVASVIGQLLGGILPDQNWIAESWRLIFLINLPIGVLAVLATAWLIPKDLVNTAQKVLFYPMFQLFVVLILLIYPLIKGPELHWPLWSIVMLTGALLLLFLFIRKQQRIYHSGQQAMLNFSLFKNRVFNLGLLIAVAYYMVQDSYFIINSNYLQTVKNFTSTDTGIAFVYQGIGYVVASIIASRLVHKYGKKVILWGVTLMVVSLAIHLWVLDQYQLDPIHIHLLFFCYGMGCGSVLPSLMTLALRGLDESLIGVGSALYLTVQQLAICLGIAFVVGLYYNTTNPSFLGFQQLSSAYGYATLLAMGLLALVWGIVAWSNFFKRQEAETIAKN